MKAKTSLALILSGIALLGFSAIKAANNDWEFGRAKRSVPARVYKINEELEKIGSRRIGDMNEAELSATISHYRELAAEKKEIYNSSPGLEKTVAYVNNPSDIYSFGISIAGMAGLALVYVGATRPAAKERNTRRNAQSHS